jgi:hypothetical protein
MIFWLVRTPTREVKFCSLAVITNNFTEGPFATKTLGHEGIRIQLDEEQHAVQNTR